MYCYSYCLGYLWHLMPLNLARIGATLLTRLIVIVIVTDLGALLAGYLRAQGQIP
jgi:hypothetical protein